MMLNRLPKLLGSVLFIGLAFHGINAHAEDDDDDAVSTNLARYVCYLGPQYNSAGVKQYMAKNVDDPQSGFEKLWKRMFRSDSDDEAPENPKLLRRLRFADLASSSDRTSDSFWANPNRSRFQARIAHGINTRQPTEFTCSDFQDCNVLIIDGDLGDGLVQSQEGRYSVNSLLNSECGNDCDRFLKHIRQVIWVGVSPFTKKGELRDNPGKMEKALIKKGRSKEAAHEIALANTGARAAANARNWLKAFEGVGEVIAMDDLGKYGSEEIWNKLGDYLRTGRYMEHLEHLNELVEFKHKQPDGENDSTDPDWLKESKEQYDRILNEQIQAHDNAIKRRKERRKFPLTQDEEEDGIPPVTLKPLNEDAFARLVFNPDHWSYRPDSKMGDEFYGTGFTACSNLETPKDTARTRKRYCERREQASEEVMKKLLQSRFDENEPLFESWLSNHTIDLSAESGIKKSFQQTIDDASLSVNSRLRSLAAAMRAGFFSEKDAQAKARKIVIERLTNFLNLKDSFKHEQLGGICSLPDAFPSSLPAGSIAPIHLSELPKKDITDVDFATVLQCLHFIEDDTHKVSDLLASKEKDSRAMGYVLISDRQKASASKTAEQWFIDARDGSFPLEELNMAIAYEKLAGLQGPQETIKQLNEHWNELSESFRTRLLRDFSFFPEMAPNVIFMGLNDDELYDDALVFMAERNLADDPILFRATMARFRQIASHQKSDADYLTFWSFMGQLGGIFATEAHQNIADQLAYEFAVGQRNSKAALAWADYYVNSVMRAENQSLVDQTSAKKMAHWKARVSKLLRQSQSLEKYISPGDDQSRFGSELVGDVTNMVINFFPIDPYLVDWILNRPAPFQNSDVARASASSLELKLVELSYYKDATLRQTAKNFLKSVKDPDQQKDIKAFIREKEYELKHGGM